MIPGEILILFVVVRLLRVLLAVICWLPEKTVWFCENLDARLWRWCENRRGQ